MSKKKLNPLDIFCEKNSTEIIMLVKKDFAKNKNKQLHLFIGLSPSNAKKQNSIFTLVLSKESLRYWDYIGNVD